MKPRVIFHGLLFVCIFGSCLSTPTQAQGQSFMQSGKWIVSLQVAENQARVADTNGILPSIFFPYNQNGLDLGIGYGLNNHWAVSLSGNWSFASFKRTVDSLPSNYVENVKTSSWGIRGGLDCYIPVTEKFILVAGPGLMFARSKIKLEVEPPGGTAYDLDNPWFSSLSLSGRLGGFLKLSSNFGLYGNFGQQYSYSWFNVNSGGQEQNWKIWSSSFDARMGVAVYFGGTK